MSVIRGRIYTVAGSALVSAGMGAAFLALAPQAAGPLAGPPPHRVTAGEPSASTTQEARAGGPKPRPTVTVTPQLVDQRGGPGGAQPRREPGTPPGQTSRPGPHPTRPAPSRPAPTRSASPQPTTTVTAKPSPSTVPVLALPCNITLVTIKLGLCGPGSNS